MTQKTIKALYKQPVNYKLIRDGYKTTNGVIQAQDGMPKVVDLSVPSELYTTDLQYNVDVNVNGAPVITTSEFTLPDDQTCEAKKYCYAPKGMSYNYIEKQNVRHYDNFTKTGNPTIYNTSVFTNFNSSNYLTLPTNFNSGNNSWEMLFKIKSGTDITTEQSWIGSSNQTNFTYPLWRLQNGYVCLYLSSNGSSWDISSNNETFQMNANTWYWVKLKFTGLSYESYYSIDGINYTLAYSLESSVTIYQNQRWNIGVNNWTSNQYHPWLGEIDLAESYIKINNEIWWQPYREVYEETIVPIPGILDSSVTTDDWQQNQEYKLYQLKNQNNTDSLQLTENSITDTSQKYKQYINQLTIPARDYKWYYHSIETGVYDNYNVIGSPIVNTTTGVVSGFSTRNAIQLKSTFDTTLPWELQLKFHTSNATTRQKLNGCVNSVDYNFPTIEFGRDGIAKFKVCISSNGTSWNISDAGTGTYTILPDTNYWIRYGWTGTVYYLDYSLDGITFIRDIEVTSTVAAYKSQYYMGIGNDMWSSSSQAPFLGTIDLSESYIKINGNIWWSPIPIEDKWLANKSIYTQQENVNSADILDFSKSYVNVSDSEYHKYINPKVCLMPIDGGENVTTYALNAITVGNISFDSSTGIVNNFSANDYLKLSSVFNPGSTPWEMVFKIKTPSSNSGAANQPIFETAKDTNDAGRYGFQIVVVDGQKLMIQMSSDGSSWTGGWISSAILSYNTNYWIKADYDGTTYRFYYSTDGITYTKIDEETSSGLYEQPVISCIGMGVGALDGGFTGEIDLSQSYIKINDQIWWQGVTISEIKEHQYILGNKILSGCLYNYNDDGSEHSFDVYYDSNYTQPILVSAGESYSEGTKVDTITIPAHRTWDYQAGGNWSPIS